MKDEIVLYTDSSSDLSNEEYRELNVKFIPLITTINDKDYADRIDMTPDEFYRKLEDPDVVPKTSMISPQRFENEFIEDIQLGKTIIFLSLSSGISSSVNSARIAKENLNYDKLHIIDSLGACVGQGLMIRKACELRDKGLDAESIVNEVEKMRDKMEYLFCPGSLEMLKRGGRISSAKAAIGTILKIKPICNFDKGYIKMFSKVRGEKALIKFFINYIKENPIGEERRIAIGHAQNMRMVELIKKALNENFGLTDIVVGEIGAVIGSHTGKETITVCYEKE